MGTSSQRNGTTKRQTQKQKGEQKGGKSGGAPKKKSAGDIRKDEVQQICEMNANRKRLKELQNDMTKEGESSAEEDKEEENASTSMREETKTDKTPLQSVVGGDPAIVSDIGMESASVGLKSVLAVTDVRTGKRNPLHVHYELNRKELGGKISTAITAKVWAEVKFINKADAWNIDDDFAIEIMDELNIGHECRTCFWLMFKEDARKRLVKKRANVVTTIRNAANKARDLEAEYPDSATRKVPTVKELLEMRENPTAFQWMAENLLTQAAADRSLVANVSKKSKVSEWCTVSTEAFVYLVMSNFEKDKGTKEKHDGKWTTGTKKGAGWEDAGIAEYNRLFGLVDKDRKKNHKVDEELLEKYEGITEGRKSITELTKVKTPVKAVRSKSFGKKRHIEEV